MTGAEGPALRLATRGSALALAQSRIVADGLRAAWPELRVELVTVVTEGDRRRDVPAAALGGKGIFTAAVQQAVLDGRADLAVHSAKDLPAAQAPGLVLAAVPERDDPRDVLVGRHRLTGLDDLAPGARVGRRRGRPARPGDGLPVPRPGPPGRRGPRRRRPDHRPARRPHPPAVAG